MGVKRSQLVVALGLSRISGILLKMKLSICGIQIEGAALPSEWLCSQPEQQTDCASFTVERIDDLPEWE